MDGAVLKRTGALRCDRSPEGRIAVQMLWRVLNATVAHIVVLRGEDGNGLEAAPAHRDNQRVAILQDFPVPPVLLHPHLHVSNVLLLRQETANEAGIGRVEIVHKLTWYLKITDSSIESINQSTSTTNQSDGEISRLPNKKSYPVELNPNIKPRSESLIFDALLVIESGENGPIQLRLLFHFLLQCIVVRLLLPNRLVLVKLRVKRLLELSFLGQQTLRLRGLVRCRSTPTIGVPFALSFITVVVVVSVHIEVVILEKTQPNYQIELRKKIFINFKNVKITRKNEDINVKKERNHLKSKIKITYKIQSIIIPVILGVKITRQFIH